MAKRTAFRAAVVGGALLLTLAGCGKSKQGPTSVVPAIRVPITYTIKVQPYAAVGAEVVHQDIHKQTVSQKLLDEGGKLIKEGKKTKANEVKYVQTILVGGEQRPKQLRRTYSRALEITDDKAQPLPYQGRTILFELIKDKYEVTVVGEPMLSADEISSLARKVGKQDAVEAYVPREPVKVGQEWPIDMQKVAKLYAEVGTLLDTANSTGTAKLIKVYTNKGHQFGVIDLTMTLAIKSMMKQYFGPPASLELKGTLDTAIDGSATLGKLSTNGKLAHKTLTMMDGKRCTLDVVVELSGEEERTAKE